MPNSAPDAYVAGLTLLAARELSEAQVRQRLRHKGYADPVVDAAVARLKEARALDDRRVAEAIVRSEATLRSRGRRRAEQRLARAGIAPAIAREAVAQVYAELDPDALLEAVLSKRLRGRTYIADARERARLYRYLIQQGFDSDRALSALRKRARGDAE